MCSLEQGRRWSIDTQSYFKHPCSCLLVPRRLARTHRFLSLYISYLRLVRRVINTPLPPMFYRQGDRRSVQLYFRTIVSYFRYPITNASISRQVPGAKVAPVVCDPEHPVTSAGSGMIVACLDVSGLLTPYMSYPRYPLLLVSREAAEGEWSGREGG